MRPADNSFAIVIPTFNRRYLLANTVLAHCEILERAGTTDIDIVVSDNCSPDGTADLVREISLRHPFVKLLTYDRHVDTSEENILQALKRIDYSYVWLFGDDDFPNIDAVFKIRHALLNKGCDFVLTNMVSLDSGTCTIVPGRGPNNAIVGDVTDQITSIEELTRRYGFQSVMACVSAVAFRRQLFLDGNLEHYLESSPIYSHVATYLDGFQNSRCLFIAEPLIQYRTGATRMSNWVSFARKQKHSVVTRPWTLGVTRLFRELRTREKISRSLLFEVREHDANHIYSVWVHVVNVLLQAAESAITTQTTSQLLSASEIDEILEEFALSAPDVKKLECMRRISRIYDIARSVLTTFTAALLEENETPGSRSSLPAMMRLLDETAKAEIFVSAASWIHAEAKSVRDLTH